MKVIAGSLSGRTFDSPKNRQTHPMSEKIRGGLFNTLGDIDGLRVLDVYAGSGAIGFEAISRGATRVVAIEKDRRAQQVIVINMEQLGIGERIELMRASVESWLRNAAVDRYYLIICDPPFEDINSETIKLLSARLNEHGLLAINLPSKFPLLALEGREVIKQNSYGDAKLVFYR